MRHFEDVQFHTSAHPRNYAELGHDPEFRGLLDASLSAHRVLVVEYTNLIRKIEALASALDAEIARLR